MDNPETLATLDTKRRKTRQKTQHNMCWTPLYAKNTNNVNNTRVILQTTRV